MAAAGNSGGHSPTTNSRNEKVFEDAHRSGCINLSGRKLKDFPQCAHKYDLSDTVTADLSKNRFVELPREVCRYESLENLSCYHNVLRVIPEALGQLQALVHLNLGRNQLTVLPPVLCNLPHLEVLLAANNRLVSLPEEISRLERLMELDVSCNEITHLPLQLGDLKGLRHLSVRRNLLVELPQTVSRLKLHKMDFSNNKIAEIPCDVHTMETLQEMRLEHNPLTCPPSHLCTKGLVHIKKYLFIQALKENRKRGHLSDVQLRKAYRKSGSVGTGLRNATDFRFNGAGDDRSKRNTMDSGYSTTDSNEKMRWSPSEVNNGDLEEANNLALRAAESVKEQRQERENQRQRNHVNPRESRQPGTRDTDQAGSRDTANTRDTIRDPARDPAASSAVRQEVILTPSLSVTCQYSPAPGDPPTPTATPPATPPHATPPGSSNHTGAESSHDAFTRFDSPTHNMGPSEWELQRQKSDYEAKKKRAEQLRLEREKSRGSSAGHERSGATTAGPQRGRDDRDSLSESLADSFSSGSSNNDLMEASQPPANHRTRLSQSSSFREDKKTGGATQQPYRRTVSDTHYGGARYAHGGHQGAATRGGRDSEDNTLKRNGRVGDQSPGATSDTSPQTPETKDAPRVHYIPVIHDTSPQKPQDDEFRRRHEAMLSQQRQEAQLIQRRLEAQKQHILRMQSDMVHKWSSMGRGATSDADELSHDASGASASAAYNGSAATNHQTNTLPPRCQKILESLEPELNSLNPAFTMRRNIHQAQQEMEQIVALRKTIESRLKVTLPENLPAALKDGVVLCHLANHIRPRSVSSIHVPSPAVPKLPLAKCRRNVENFLEACRRIGVEQEKLFVPLDILEERGILDVAYTVRALISRAPHEQKMAAV